MKQGTIVHPGRAGALSAFYPSRATVFKRTTSKAPSGRVVEHFTDPLHSDVECALAPRTTGPTPAGSEIKYRRATHKLQLNGYYPTVTKRMQVEVDGVRFKIDGVETSSLKDLTDLFVWELV